MTRMIPLSVPDLRGREREYLTRCVDDNWVSSAGPFVVEMERRMAALGGFVWTDTTAVQAYTIHDIHPFLADEVARRGAARHGLTWQFCRPPVRDLEYEMDCRGVPVERVLPAG